MPRSSRHRSHREHKYRERSDSEEDRNSRDPKERVEERDNGSRVSRDLESKKRTSSSVPQPSQGKDQTGAGGGYVSVEHGRKRKDREEDSAASDRLNGAREDDRVADLGHIDENFGLAESKKAPKSKLSAVASRERASRRPEGSAERYEDGSSKVELTKRRSEKDLSRDSSHRESISQCKDAKEKGRERGSEKDLSRDLSHRESSNQYKDAKEKERDRGLERDKKVHGSRHERPNDAGSRNQAAKTGFSEEERALKKDRELTEWQIRDELRNAELEKELEKPMRGGDGSADRDKWQSDGRDSDDRRLSSRDDCPRNESDRNERHRDERHKDGKYRDKHREDLDRDQRHRDDRHREELSSRDHTSNRSDSKRHRDENRISENRYKRSKPQDSDHGGSYFEDHSTKYKDSRERRRSFDENDAYGDSRPQSAKESHGDVDRARPDKIDSNRSNKRPKSSPSSVGHAIKDQSRHSLRQAEPARQELPSGERDHYSVATMGDLAGVSGGHDRTSDSRSLEKTKTKDHVASGEYLIETAASSKFGKTQRSDGRSASVQLMEKSHSIDRQFLYRGSTRRSHDIEDVAKKSSSYRDQRDYPIADVRERKLLLKNPSMDDYSKAENCEHVPLGPSSFNRNDRFLGSLPGHLPPPQPVRHGIDSPVLGSYEDDNISQIGDRKSSSRYRKNSDLNTGRGQGSDWKSIPTWPSPVANSFPPFQHGPMPPGFPSSMQHFPAPSLFGMRPYMDVTHAHVRPFGWHNIMESPYPPQLQGWDGRNGVLGDDSHAYGRPEWDHQNRHLMDSRGWETSAATWKVQHGNLNIEISQPQESDYSTHSLPDEGWAGQSGNKSSSEQARSESSEIKRSIDAPSAKNAAEAPPETIDEKTPAPSKTAGDDRSRYCCNYLSKLDISVDLASPELYKQCLTLLGTRDPGVCNISKHGCHQNVNDVNKVVGKSPNNLLTSLFPTNTEAYFQRAMSLYKKQRDVAKAMFPVVTAKGEKDSLEVSDADKAKVIDEQPPEEMSLANANSCRSKEEEGSNVIAEAKDNVSADAKERKNTNANAPGDLSGDAKEQHSDVISDAVVFGEGSQACEAVRSECRVNLSRIPISPESTH
ncbi:zinc finger CCCH domain-containing protein 13-like [Phoenix dactylifera]|uniref:Zinc finger CCCH domain-containing protein 13-like n=1 Tax=Phoenix dactylifera TaxID=42345 RepID=A0A8B9AM37_PHODC|nr:zinc finger CCCH domain-containing protein 13-like [Phoenix dactylifera]